MFALLTGVTFQACNPKTDTYFKSHGPLSIASNLAKLLGRWGVLEALEPRCCKPTGVEYFSCTPCYLTQTQIVLTSQLKHADRSGEHLRTWTWKEVVYEATGFHYHLTDVRLI